MVSVEETAIPAVKIVTPKKFGDHRGFFSETWSRKAFAEAGLDLDFVQDNHSRSVRGVLRGLHYQVVKPQAKLVRAGSGVILDVAVDLRRSSPTFGQHVAVELSAENKRQLWIPEGFGHGFAVLSDNAELLYKTTEFWFPEHDRSLAWDDPALKIDWRLDDPILSDKDRQAPRLDRAELF